MKRDPAISPWFGHTQHHRSAAQRRGAQPRAIALPAPTAPILGDAAAGALVVLGLILTVLLLIGSSGG